MGDRPVYTDAPQAPSPPSPLLQDSGFLSGLKKLGHSAATAVESGVDQGKKLAHSDAARKLTGEVTAAGHQVMNSPTTGRIVNSVKASGQAVAHEDVAHVNGALQAGRRGDIAGVIGHVAPLAEQAALGPTGVVLKVGKDAAIAQAPPAQREALKRVSDGLPHLTITGLVTEAAVQHTQRSTVAEVQRPENTANLQSGDMTTKAESFFKGLGGKIHFSKDSTTPPTEKKE